MPTRRTPPNVTPYTPPTADQFARHPRQCRDRGTGAERTLRPCRTRSGRKPSSKAWGNSAAGEFAPLNRIGDLEGAKLRERRGAPARRVQGGLQCLCRTGLERGIASPAAHEWSGPALHIVVQRAGKPRRGQYGLYAAPDALGRAIEALEASRQARISRRNICPISSAGAGRGR